MTIREAININPKVELALYSSQIDLNLPIYHDFSPNSRGYARGSWRGQIFKLWYLFAMIVELSSVTCYNIANNHIYDVVTSYRSQLDDYGK